MTYAGTIDVNIYVKRNFAPFEDRVRSIIAMENGAPHLFEQAKANLEDSLAKPMSRPPFRLPKVQFFLSNDLRHRPEGCEERYADGCF